MFTNRPKEARACPKVKGYVSTGQAIELLENARNRPPTFRFKVESYSKLCVALNKKGIDHFDSSVFKASDYQWMMSVYPTGNKSANGHGHISLYLKLVDQLTGDQAIYATIRFFIYEHLHGVYWSIQDVCERRFDVLNTQSGIPDLLPLTIFTDPDNGLLINDCCIFGAEVLIAPQENKVVTSLSPVQELVDSDISYIWRVYNFSKLNKDSRYSPVFNLGGYDWSLRMCLDGEKGSEGKSLSLFLCRSPTFTTKVFVEFELYLKDQVRGKHKKKTASTWFPHPRNEFGFHEFTSLNDLTMTSTWFPHPRNEFGFHEFTSLNDLTMSKRYLVNDTVMVEIGFLMMFEHKDLS